METEESKRRTKGSMGTTFCGDEFTANVSYCVLTGSPSSLPPPSPHNRLRLLSGQWQSVRGPNALAGAQGPARMEPIQQPASRCSPKQSSRLEREQRAGKGDRNLIAYH